MYRPASRTTTVFPCAVVVTLTIRVGIINDDNDDNDDDDDDDAKMKKW